MAKIISIVPYPFLPARMGGQKGVALFYKYFSRHLSLITVTTKKNDPLAADGYEVMNILSDSKLRYINIFYLFKLGKIIREAGATHLLLEHPYYGWLGIILKKWYGVKLIVHSHNIENLRWKSLGKWWWPILRIYEKATHRAADYNFFVQKEDLAYGIRHFRLSPARCLLVTYGTESSKIPDKGLIDSSRQNVRARYRIEADEKLLLFNGSFNHYANLSGLYKIIDIINPKLQEKADFSYKILICGKDIPEDLMNGNIPNLLFAGFVEDIDEYFRAADIFLNPIVEGGGIKTKLVEALANNLNSVSTVNGAIGVDQEICNGKLFLSEDGDWIKFTDQILEAARFKADISNAFFYHFYWASVAEKAARFVEN
jgi:hypothetical protein